MKKLLLIALLLSAPVFAKEQDIKSKYYRFGMNILPLSYGYGISLDGITSFYVANDNYDIISFGFNTSFRFRFTDAVVSVASSSESMLEETPLLIVQAGVFAGFGKLYPVKSNSALHIGYLINFHAGYSSHGFMPYSYLGIEPAFALEIDQFIFKLGFYVDTSLVITSKAGFGFLLKK